MATASLIMFRKEDPMHSLTFQIMGVTYRLESPFEIIIRNPIRPFLLDADAKHDILVRFQPADVLPEPAGENWVEDICYASNGVFFRNYFNLPPYACLCEAEDGYLCTYLSEFQHYVHSSDSILNMLGLEQQLLAFGGMMLHASFIRYQGKGILFTAPCGTGKSTQAALWEQFMGADILNGDRTGIRSIDGHCVGFGLPFAGTSRIYRNEQVPICAIVALSQAPQNTVSRLRPSQAMAKLLPELSCRRWDAEFMTRIFDLSVQLVQDVPVYHLACTPDREAVATLFETLKREGLL